MARVETFYCNECDDIVTADRIDHRRNCKGKPVAKVPEKQPVKQPEPIKEPVKESPYIEDPIKASERALRWQQDNRERYNEYKREYMRRKRKEARELN